ncbi:uncharacterized protein PV09_02660 [Verruconis gallopava]|uniref:Peptide hydrolase n=1 Tax=Verruconis gallopava TaxID=253628 RepID=A0A0D2AHW8_9PEZI|nr:uncharacterized protein PV09_02660 [Verruconis gallopava]KIW06175.1 hypothetical protein PV09_02660 [Verruconis gallopava]
MARPYKSRNPLGFTPWPVAFWTTIIFASLLSSLITVHNTVPPAPKSELPAPGINLTQAWLDLQHLSNGFHPYNSRRNNEIRTWLLERIDEIVATNALPVSRSGGRLDWKSRAQTDTAVHIYNDLDSSLIFGSRDSSLSVAYTGENIIVYIRGSEDEPGFWWEDGESDIGHKSGVLINAHYDSVPSGFGATDDGIGVVSVLQVISYYTTQGNQPKRGVVALLNNGEEDYLNGAFAFTQHPISKFPHTFLNLEGAGAGGKAVLFRSTDAEVTKSYQRSPHPFGSVVSLDGFKRKLVRSDTDYSVFAPELGMRGLDIAFFEPRARYHTIEDSARFTSRESLWHMLSAAIATMDGLTSDLSDKFEGPPAVAGGVHAGKGHDSVFFDLFGRTFAIFQLHTLFAISVTLLVVTPIVLIGVELILIKSDKWYLFARKQDMGDAGVVQIRAFRGFFRFPLVFTVSTAAVVGFGLLVAKVNPYVLYSSPYSVWSMMLSAWFAITWFLLKGADSMRPSALQRAYGLLWLYIGAYITLVGATVLQNNFGIAGSYFIVIYFGAVFLALLLSYFELFALPKKTTFAEKIIGDGGGEVPSSRPLTRDDQQSSRRQSVDMLRQLEEDDANERTSLLRGYRQGTFSGGYGGTRGRSTDESAATDDDELLYLSMPPPYPKEQVWSGFLPSWTWLLQLFLVTILPLILIGQIGLLMTSSLYQTASDGSGVLIVYLFLAAITTLFVTPVAPFIHRIQWPLPTIICLICVATAIYNLTAFPFSEHSRLKVYFLQQVDLDSGVNHVSLTGLMPYAKDIAKSIPSSAGQVISCSAPDYSARSGLTKCSWSGIAPNPMNLPSAIPPEKFYKTWLTFNASRVQNTTNSNVARFTIDAKNTRACRILFDNPIVDVNVTGFGTDSRFPRVHKGVSSKSIRLWRRQWDDAPWEVFVTWADQEKGLDGQVVCLWSDANDPKSIPAFEEVKNFMPVWSIATKLSDGLVEGSKRFKV